MSNFEFQSQLFDTSSQMHAAIAHAWLSADGLNDAATICRFFAISTDNKLAKECEEAWELCDSPDYSHDELVQAFADLR
jgi:hypothetical protein